MHQCFLSQTKIFSQFKNPCRVCMGIKIVIDLPPWEMKTLHFLFLTLSGLLGCFCSPKMAFFQIYQTIASAINALCIWCCLNLKSPTPFYFWLAPTFLRSQLKHYHSMKLFQTCHPVLDTASVLPLCYIKNC